MSSTGTKLSKHFADVMVSVYKACFASAITEVNVNIIAEEEIIIKDTSIDQLIESKNACELDKDYKVLSTIPFTNALDTRLDSAILPGNVTNIEFTDHKRKVKAIMSQFISISILTKCIAVAVSSITLRLNAAKTVSINNLQIDQAARAVIVSCVQNTRVDINGKTKTMAQHIDDLDPVPIKVVPVDPDEEEKEEKNAQKELDEFNALLIAWGAKKPLCGEGGKDNPTKITIATSIGMVGILIMIILLIVVSQYKKKLAKI